jgi:hypothetical protein
VLIAALSGGLLSQTVGDNISVDVRGNHAIMIVLLIAKITEKALRSAR